MTNVTKQDFLAPGTVIQLGVTPRRIDLLTEISGISYEEAEAERQLITISDLAVPVIGISHLIKNKKAAGRPQDQADVARLEALHA